MTRSALALIILAGIVWGQRPTPVSFEVASIKPALPSQPRAEIRIEDDRIDFPSVTLWYCVSFAYQVRSYQMSGPPWLKTARFNVSAKGPVGTRFEQLPKMMQTLLAERLKLQVHRETREMGGLALIAGKNGPDLKIAAAGNSGGGSFNIEDSPEGGERLQAKNADMDGLATMLTSLLGRPVVNRTGLAGRYDFGLDFTRDETAGGTLGGFNEPPQLPPPAPGPAPGISIYTSIQRIGLKLESQRLSVDVVVVDRAERVPTEN